MNKKGEKTMKKSEIYRLAQDAVVNVPYLKTHEKLEILRELMNKEDVALFTESQDEVKE